MSRIFEEFNHPAIQTKIVQHFGGFFHQTKVRQPIGRKDSIQTMIQANMRLDMDIFLYEAAQNFIQTFKTEIKIKKLRAVDVLFKDYPMVLLSCRSNLAGGYL